MSSIRYAIRNILEPVHRALQELAKQKDRSFNQTVVDALKKPTGRGGKIVSYKDLDWFIGSKHANDKFDEAMAWLDTLPSDMSKS